MTHHVNHEKENIQQDDRHTEKGSQLQSNQMEKAQGNKDKDSKEKQ